MSIVSQESILDFLAPATGTEENLVIDIHAGVEDWVKGYCRRTFENTSYALERYNGTGTPNLYLKNYPVTALTRLAIGSWDVLSVTNTNNNTYATVSVSDTGITLSRAGVVDVSLTFAGYTTISLISAAITAAGNGWTSSVLDTRFSSYSSSSLLKRWGANCNDNYTVWLQMPYPYTTQDFDLYDERGQIILKYSSFPKGKNNVFVTYTAGYTSATMPEDLKTGIRIFCKNVYDKYKDDMFNVASYRIGEFSVSYLKEGNRVPNEAVEMFASYKRYLI